MKVDQICLQNFRGARELGLDLSKGQTSVLVGANGAGKSTVLDCAAILLSRLVRRVRSGTAGGRAFSPSDISNWSNETVNEIAVRWGTERFTWSVSKVRSGRSGAAHSHLHEVTDLASRIRDCLSDDEEASLPVLVYYPVNRAVLDIPLRIRKRHVFDQVSTYDESLSGASSSFRVFFEWFRLREDYENELRLDKPQSRDPQLEAVRRAVSRFLPGISQLRVRRAPLRMVVTKEEHEINVSQMSDGEKCLLAMVGDLARRLAVANPKLPEPLRGAGVVLIDELELHLHPVWQRAVVPALEQTFPNCQFLVSTHSAPILGHVRHDCVFLLSREPDNIIARRMATYGQDTDRILEEVFGASARPQEVDDAIQNIFREIEDGRLVNARSKTETLEQAIGIDDPELVKARVLIRRKELLGK